MMTPYMHQDSGLSRSVLLLIDELPNSKSFESDLIKIAKEIVQKVHDFMGQDISSFLDRIEAIYSQEQEDKSKYFSEYMSFFSQIEDL